MKKELDVFIIGYELTSQFDTVHLWKNGVSQNLTYEEKHAYYDHSLCISKSGNVYNLGWGTNAQGESIITLFKNGVEQSLIGNNGVIPDSVYVSGDDVYVMGRGFVSNSQGISRFTNVIWKNNVSQSLSMDENNFAGATSICVYGEDVYYAGWRETDSKRKVATLWKNGIEQNITDGTNDAVAFYIYVAHNDIYVVGYEENEQGYSVAKLWKNSIEQNLTDGNNNAEAYSIFVSDNDVYVVGSEKNAQGNYVAILWINGKAQALTDGKNHAWACSIFVK